MRLELYPGKWIGGEEDPCFIIAEGGINHQGDVNIAKDLIRVAKENGADAIKFQKRTISRILTKEGLNAPYTSVHSFGATYGEHKEKLELSKEDWMEMKRYADEIGISFFASGWDEESVDFLDEIGVQYFKIASADLTNFPLLEYTARKGKPILLSTGMANMDMVQSAVQFLHRWHTQIVLMQCTSTYPAKMEEIDLNVITTYRREFPRDVIGYSGHEKGIAISLAAVVMGAKVIERHLTLDRTMKGNDHAASLEPHGFGNLVRDIRAYEIARGSGIKRIQESERPIFKKLGKSIVYVGDLKKGTLLCPEHLTVKGPGTGISPMSMYYCYGRRLKRDVDGDTLMKVEDIEEELE
jgi:sialic acid synthase